ncbi:MAG: FeoB-associated Cys-rich membrane protein [Clostridia bacterium]|nr:FeoB-associated Cys-rich membrane protein [Clostridia bacterium]
MLQFLQMHGITILVLLILALVVFLIIRKLIKDKKAGVGACGCKCAGCPHAANCHRH